MKNYVNYTTISEIENRYCEVAIHNFTLEGNKPIFSEDAFSIPCLPGDNTALKEIVMNIALDRKIWKYGDERNNSSNLKVCTDDAEETILEINYTVDGIIAKVKDLVKTNELVPGIRYYYRRCPRLCL